MITDDVPFLKAYNAFVSHIERTYGIPIHVRDVPDPFTGDLDGTDIQVDYDLAPADALFIAAHLVGHTIQWNVSAQERAIGLLPVPTPCVDEALLCDLEAYERQAARYSLHALHDAGIRDLDQWFSDYAECDVKYLLNFYRTGAKREPLDFWVDGTPVVAPLTIPSFTLTRWIDSRNRGIVI
ncbi:MAG: hypothetical protein ABJE10_00340 [bacterium]